jgi:hypothetical protein
MKIRKLQIAIMAGALVMAAQARASIVPVGDPYATHSWAQAFTDTEGFTFNAVQEVYVAGSAFEIPGLTGLSGGFVSTFSTPTVSVAAGPGTTSLNWTLNFTGSGSDANLIFALYDNGVAQAVYQLFSGSYFSLGSANIGSGWSLNTLNTADAPALVPEPTTMVAGAMLLLPFGASTIRRMRKTRTA